MAEENKTIEETREEKEKVKEVKKEEKKAEEKVEKVEEKKPEETKKKEKAGQEKPKARKSEAIAFGRDAGISTKHAIAICDAIRGKKADDALALMENVVKKKRAIAMKGEIPHRKEKGIMAGRYPVKAAGFFVKLIKSLRANAENVGIDADAARIYFANANLASRPHRRFGSERFKRTHVLLKLKEPKSEEK